MRVDDAVERDGARRRRAREPPSFGASGIDQAAPKRRVGALATDDVVFVDRDVVVVRKPAGLLTCPYEDGDKNTLVDRTRATLRRMGGSGAERYDPVLGVVHRLDKDTTGLLVFARTLPSKRALEHQFRRHTVERRYLALAQGEAESGTHETQLLANRGDGLRGSWGVFRAPVGKPPASARRAITHVRVLERLVTATLVECRLETGRQHQIRIHLSEAGHPLLGERVYIRETSGPRFEAPRPMLHAATLGFEHPRTGEPVRFEDDLPEDFRTLLTMLRARPL